MNTRKMLARLGPKTPQLTRIMHGSGGSGSSSDTLTPQDIAAAMGFIRNKLGGDLYGFLWIPNAINSPIKKASLILRFAKELRNEQLDRILTNKKPFANPIGKQTVVDIYSIIYCQNIANACITELTKRNDCTKCFGYGEILWQKEAGKAFTTIDCPSCTGTGTMAFSKENRAKLLGIRRQTFQDVVEEAYVWLLGYMREQEQLAASEHWEALQ